MSENKCSPFLNIKSPEELLDVIKKINNISSNRPLTIQDIENIVPEEIIDTISRENQPTRTTQDEEEQNTSRPNSSGGGGGGGGGKKSCKPKNSDKVGAWNFPKSSYGMVIGTPIKPRELNCNCEK